MKFNILGKEFTIESSFFSNGEIILDKDHLQELQDKYEKLIKIVIECISIFSHYSYFSNKLWMKKKKYKNIDEIEIHMAFLSSYLFHEGIYINAVGSTFALTDKEGAERFLNRFKNLWKDYYKWCNDQR